MTIRLTSIAVSWGVQNGDAHLKNFGVLYDDPNGSVNLSPAFDIVSTTAYIRNDVPALTLGGSKKWWKLQQLENFGQSHCGLKPVEAREALRRLAQALTEQSRAIESFIEQRPVFNEAGRIMLEIFAHSATTRSSHLEGKAVKAKRK
ncbi:MAG: serine/threonine-protein kinase HipA [Zhongshania sp.]|jgi:serine/threonine-protein kinase HipA